jgi:hypothetical protein
MHKRFLSLKLITYCLLLSGFLSVVSCQKNSDLVKATAIVSLTVTSFSTNSDAAFAVLVNNEIVEDSLVNGNTQTKLVAVVDGLEHVLIKDAYTNAVLIDTMLEFHGKKAVLTLLQLQQGQSPILVGGTEENIPEHHRLQSFFYTTDVLPDAVACQLYACHYDPATFAFIKTDTMATWPEVRKGVLSESMLVPDNPDPSAIIYFWQLLDVQTQQPLANMAMPFDPANYLGYQFSFGAGTTGTEQHYINNFFTLGSAEFFDLFSDRLLSY